MTRITKKTILIIVFVLGLSGLALSVLALSVLSGLGGGGFKAWRDFASDDEIYIQHGTMLIGAPKMRPALPGTNITAAYMTLTNNAETQERLLSVHFDSAEKSQIHTMDIVDDIMKMRPLKGGLIIPPHETIRLEPGGLHLMFIGLKHRPQIGDNASITLDFERTGSLTLTMPVQNIKHHKHTKNR